MPDYLTASWTKDHFQAQLLGDHPEIVSIAPQLKLDEAGYPTKDGVIVIGIAPRNPLSPSVPAARVAKPIPTKLPAVDARGSLIAGEEVDVIVEVTGEIVPHMNTARLRPCLGGFSVGHTLVTAGTCGGNARSGANFGFILSNNHVLAAVNAGAVGDPIVQPGPIDGGVAPADTIAQLTRFVPINLSGGNNEVDCALAQAGNPADIQRNVQGIGIPAVMANATVGQAIRKSGRTTQLTTGTITSDNATIRVTYGAGQVGVFVNQLQYTKMAAGGDSGSLVWDAARLTVVGLHFAGDTLNGSDYGNKILRVLELLSRPFTVYDLNGKPTHFRKADISLLERPKPRSGGKPGKTTGRRPRNRE